MKQIAIIPARGGSKRLPRKNILDLHGCPLISYPIKAAIKSELFENVFVSTEDSEIAEISKKYGATVINRPVELAQDTSTVVEVCLSVVRQIKVENFCCIYATAALLSSRSIQDSYQVFKNDERINYLMGVSEFNYHPVQALKEDKNGDLSYLLPEYIGVQSQSYPKVVVSNGSFIWGRSNQFEIDTLFYSQKLKGYVLPENEVCDLDSLKDYERLKEKFLSSKS